MTDIFDARILCKKCSKQMNNRIIDKGGLQMRAVQCPKCNDKIIHPADLSCLNKFNDMRDRTFNVKLRMVGNSHAISIPKEIVDLMNEQHNLIHERHKRIKREMEDMVKLAFEDFGKLRLTFWDDEKEGVDKHGRR